MAENEESRSRTGATCLATGPHDDAADQGADETEFLRPSGLLARCVATFQTPTFIFASQSVQHPTRILEGPIGTNVKNW